MGLVLTLSKTPPFMVLAPYLFPEYPFAFVPESTGQAVEEVRNQYRQKVDSVKPYDGLSEEAFLAVVSEAKQLGMYVHSHLPDQMQLETILTSGIDEVVHIDEFNSFHWTKSTEDVKAGFKKGKAPQLDYSLIPQTVDMMRENNIAVVSNMSADETVYQLIFDTPGVLAAPKYRVLSGLN